MKKGSKELYDLMEQFERDIKHVPVYIGAKIEREARGSANYYTNGNINNLFTAYMYGYQLAKSNARLDALTTQE